MNCVPVYEGRLARGALEIRPEAVHAHGGTKHVRNLIVVEVERPAAICHITGLPTAAPTTTQTKSTAKKS